MWTCAAPISCRPPRWSGCAKARRRSVQCGQTTASKFSGKHTHRILNGIGHNVPQEAPQPFAEAIMEVDGY